MEAPSVKNVVEDKANGIRYVVMAYRPLTEGEMRTAIGVYLGQRKRKKTKPGTIITIISIIGHNDPV